MVVLMAVEIMEGRDNVCGVGGLEGSCMGGGQHNEV